MPETAWFGKTAILKLKIKIPAKPHQNRVKLHHRNPYASSKMLVERENEKFFLMGFHLNYT